MVLIAALLHYGGIVIAMGLSAFGVALGQGIAGGGGLMGLERQELAHGPIKRSLLMGLAFIESGGVFALVFSIVLLFGVPFEPTIASGLAVLGACCGIGVASCVVGLASGRVVYHAAQAMARQPFLAGKIYTLMMLTQMLLEAPAVFAFIICFMVKAQLHPEMSMVQGVQLCASGFFIAIGSIGPAIGQSLFSAAACRATGVNIEMYPRIFQFSFVTQALIETPIIFCFLFSLLSIMRTIHSDAVITIASLFAGAVMALGLGSMGASIGSGYVAAYAVESMAERPEQYGLLFRTTFFCQAIIDTALIYTLITAFLLTQRCM